MNRLFLACSIILCCIIGSTILQIPHVFALDNQTSSNDIQKAIQDRIAKANKLKEMVNNQNSPSQSTTQLNPDSTTQTPSKLPKWIKKTFVSYAQGDISEDELLNAITFLVQNNIIKIQSVSQPSPPANTSPSTTQSNLSITGSTVDNFNFKSIYANPDSYKNQWIKFAGKVYGLESDRDAIRFDVGSTTTDPSSSVYVKVDHNLISQYSANDCLLIEGHITGSEQNSYLGGTYSNLDMNGEKITKISCLDAEYPAMKTINVDQTQTMSVAKITVEKVDFAQDHTRVKIKFENLAGVDVNIYSSKTHIIQDKSQMDTKSVYFSNEDVKTTISSGVVSEGYLFFEPTKPGSLTLSIDVYGGGASDDNIFNFNIG